MTHHDPDLRHVTNADLQQAFRRELADLRTRESDPAVRALYDDLIQGRQSPRAILHTSAGEQLLARARERARTDPLPFPAQLSELLDVDHG